MTGLFYIIKMRYLLDTNILIRFIGTPAAISKDVRNIIEDTDNLMYVSAISIQEIYMLMRDNKLNVKQWQKPFDVFNYIENELFCTVKYVQKEHLIMFAGIVPTEGHGDPFDRMIIAQAIYRTNPFNQQRYKVSPLSQTKN